MAFVNVRRDVDDKFYRYRMPVMLTKVEGRGNGIKTVIPNMSDVSKALSRPPQYPTKFFGCELGAQTILDEKTDRWIVNGEHSADRLRELLDAFIDKFVLCGACKNPETELVITKTEDIIRDCKACGQQTKVDMRHKLTTFIIKNPPKKKKSRKTTKDSQQDKEKGEEGGSGDDGSPTADNDDDDALAQRLQAEAAELPDVEKAAIAADDWSADTKADAVAKRMADLAMDDNEDEASGDHFGTLLVWLEINREQATPTGVLAKLDELGIKERHKTAQILGESLFTGSILSNKEIQKFLPVFKEVVMPKNASEVEKKEKHQKALLGGMERLVGVHYPDLIPQIPRILMEWYQADILTEEVVRQWGTHVSKKYVDRDTCKRVRKASEPFLKWLDEAEDEEDSDDE